MDWTNGYVSEIDYTHGYYRELNPHYARFVLLCSGFNMPEIKNACELGFGQGLSLSAHAASTDVHWFGNDFNPNQVINAKELNFAAESTAELFDDDFQKFCSRSDLPKFDFIGLHGIWSWISDENRQIIQKFISEKLSVGGIVYISYNTQPGWASMLPLRNLLVSHKESMTAHALNIEQRIGNSLKFAEQLLECNAKFFNTNPSAHSRLTNLLEQDINYLAHEYFNSDWKPFAFSEMANALSGVKLSFGASANILDTINVINFTDEQTKIINQIPNAIFKETVRDFMCNQAFRRDYWMKGYSRLNRTDWEKAVSNTKFILSRPKSSIDLKVKGYLGEAKLDHEVYPQVLGALSSSKILSFGELVSKFENKISNEILLECVKILLAKGDISLVQNSKTIKNNIKKSQKLNAFIANRAKGSSDISHFVSPVVGGAIAVARFDQLFLLAEKSGCSGKDEVADYVREVLASQNQNVVHEGETIIEESKIKDLFRKLYMQFVDSGRKTILENLQAKV